jgi:CBS domain containing-hemolysin-like protein
MLSTLLGYFFLAIGVSFLCSLWEAVLLSITPSYARIQLQQGARIGRRLETFKANIDRPLAAILSLNTIAHTVGAVGVGEQAIAIWSDTNPLVTGIVVPAGMTLSILILSEIIPKTIGANFWERLVPFTVYSLSVVIVLLAPLIWLCQLTTRGFKPDEAKSLFSRSDFLAMAEIGAQEGVFARQESKIIRNLIEFETVKTKSIMTPRIVVQSASEDMTIEEFYDNFRDLPFSRIPVYQGRHREDVVGYILKNDVLTGHLQGRGGETLAAIRRDLLVVHESLAITGLFNQFLEKREHIALVVDEFGGVAGIVTMEDLIETLLGTEIVDESDKAVDMQQVARQSWLRRAKAKGLSVEDEREQ